VVNGCNFACHYCYIPHLNRNVSKSEIGRHSLKKESIHPLLSNLIAYCKEHQIPELRVIFAGGEPTMNLPLVEAFCREATEEDCGIKISFGMISNGSFHFEELIPLLQRYKINISLSADGFEDSHDRIRFEINDGRKIGSWQRILHNVKLLLASGISPYFLYTVTPNNYNDISKFASFVHGNRLGFRLSLVRERAIPPMELQKAITDELRQVYRSLGETLDPQLPILRNAAFAEWDLYRKKYSPCTSCKNYFAIDTKGGVATCQMRMDRSYGNAISELFSNIVSKVQQDLANRTLANPTSKEGGCVGCEFFHVCAGGCPQHTFQTIGVMDHPSPWCRVYGALMPEYIRAIARQLQRAVIARNC
jgi:radical SAM protein with 4Fe4S-binding SPASM domain